MIDDHDERLEANMAAVKELQEEYRNPVHQVALRAGFIMCREIMARFVEHGGDGNDIKRWKTMLQNYPQRKQEAPLIARGLDKRACIAMIERAGIAPPRVYAMGFPNANCIGCVKASSPNYWSLVRAKFPAVFARRADQDDRFGRNRVIIKGKRGPLSALPADWPTTDPIAPRCDFLCQIAEEDLAA